MLGEHRKQFWRRPVFTLFPPDRQNICSQPLLVLQVTEGEGRAILAHGHRSQALLPTPLDCIDDIVTPHLNPPILLNLKVREKIFWYANEIQIKEKMRELVVRGEEERTKALLGLFLLSQLQPSQALAPPQHF